MQAAVTPIRWMVLGAVGATVLVVALVALGLRSSEAQTAPAPIQPTELTAGNRGDFTDDVSMQLRRKLEGHGTEVLNLKDPSNVAVVQFVVQPGAQFPWHMHPGPVIVTITHGELVYVQADDCVARRYPAGTSFLDTGNNVHTAYAPSGGGETRFVAVILDAPATGPLTIPTPTDPAEIAALNERCGVNVDSHGSH